MPRLWDGDGKIVLYVGALLGVWHGMLVVCGVVDRPVGWLPCFRGGWLQVDGLCENCIVDASIFILV